MAELNDIKSILLEIRDNQRRGLEQQAEHLGIAQAQLERAKVQVEESLELQRQAIAKQQSIQRIALPAILLCIALIIYLIVRYF